MSHPDLREDQADDGIENFNEFGENCETHDSPLFNPPIVEIDFYDGRRLRIPQEVWPLDWTPPF